MKKQQASAMRNSQTMPQLFYTRQDIHEQYTPLGTLVGGGKPAASGRARSSGTAQRAKATPSEFSAADSSLHQLAATDNNSSDQMHDDSEPDENAHSQTPDGERRGRGRLRSRKRRPRSHSAGLFSGCFAIPHFGSILHPSSSSGNSGQPQAAAAASSNPSHSGKRLGLLAHLGISRTSASNDQQAGTHNRSQAGISSSQTEGNLCQIARQQPDKNPFPTTNTFSNPNLNPNVNQLNSYNNPINLLPSSASESLNSNFAARDSRKHVSFGTHNIPSNSQQPRQSHSVNSHLVNQASTHTIDETGMEVPTQKCTHTVSQSHTQIVGLEELNSSKSISNRTIIQHQPGSNYQQQQPASMMMMMTNKTNRSALPYQHQYQHQPPKTLYKRLPNAVPMKTQATQTDITAYHLMSAGPTNSSVSFSSTPSNSAARMPRHYPPAEAADTPCTPSSKSSIMSASMRAARVEEPREPEVPAQSAARGAERSSRNNEDGSDEWSVDEEEDEEEEGRVLTGVGVPSKRATSAPDSSAKRSRGQQQVSSSLLSSSASSSGTNSLVGDLELLPARVVLESKAAKIPEVPEKSEEDERTILAAGAEMGRPMLSDAEREEPNKMVFNDASASMGETTMISGIAIEPPSQFKDEGGSRIPQACRESGQESPEGELSLSEVSSQTDPAPLLIYSNPSEPLSRLGQQRRDDFLTLEEEKEEKEEVAAAGQPAPEETAPSCSVPFGQVTAQQQQQQPSSQSGSSKRSSTSTLSTRHHSYCDDLQHQQMERQLQMLRTPQSGSAGASCQSSELDEASGAPSEQLACQEDLPEQSEGQDELQSGESGAADVSSTLLAAAAADGQQLAIKLDCVAALASGEHFSPPETSRIVEQDHKMARNSVVSPAEAEAEQREAQSARQASWEGTLDEDEAPQLASSSCSLEDNGGQTAGCLPPSSTVSELELDEQLSTASFVESYRNRLLQVCELADSLLSQLMDDLFSPPPQNEEPAIQSHEVCKIRSNPLSEPSSSSSLSPTTSLESCAQVPRARPPPPVKPAHLRARALSAARSGSEQEGEREAALALAVTTTSLAGAALLHQQQQQQSDLGKPIEDEEEEKLPMEVAGSSLRGSDDTAATATAQEALETTASLSGKIMEQKPEDEDEEEDSESSEEFEKPRSLPSCSSSGEQELAEEASMSEPTSSPTTASLAACQPASPGQLTWSIEGASGEKVVQEEDEPSTDNSPQRVPIELVGEQSELPGAAQVIPSLCGLVNNATRSIELSTLSELSEELTSQRKRCPDGSQQQPERANEADTPRDPLDRERDPEQRQLLELEGVNSGEEHAEPATELDLAQSEYTLRSQASAELEPLSSVDSAGSGADLAALREDCTGNCSPVLTAAVCSGSTQPDHERPLVPAPQCSRQKSLEEKSPPSSGKNPEAVRVPSVSELSSEQRRVTRQSQLHHDDTMDAISVEDYDGLELADTLKQELEPPAAFSGPAPPTWPCPPPLDAPEVAAELESNEHEEQSDADEEESSISVSQQGVLVQSVEGASGSALSSGRGKHAQSLASVTRKADDGEQPAKSPSTESATDAIMEHLSRHHRRTELTALDEPDPALEQSRSVGIAHANQRASADIDRPINQQPAQASSQVAGGGGGVSNASARRESWKRDSLSLKSPTDSPAAGALPTELDTPPPLPEQPDEHKGEEVASGTMKRRVVHAAGEGKAQPPTAVSASKQPAPVETPEQVSTPVPCSTGNGQLSGRRGPPLAQMKCAQQPSSSQLTDTSICSSCSCMEQPEAALTEPERISGSERKAANQQSAGKSLTANQQAHWMSQEEGTVYTENYWLAHWLYVSEYEESEIWRRAIDMSATPDKDELKHQRDELDQQQQQQQGLPDCMVEMSSTTSEKNFGAKYKSITRKMIHRRATLEMYKRIMSNTLRREKRVEINRSKGEFGFRIHGSRPVVVSAIERGTSAETCGLQVGDLIYAINDTNILDMAHSDVVKLAHKTNSCSLVLDLVPTNEFLKTSRYSQVSNKRYEPTVTGYLMRLSPSTAQPLLVELQERMSRATQVSAPQRAAKLNEVMRLAWRKRYFVLRSDNCLYWYRSHKDIEPYGGVNLQGFSASLTNEFGEPNYVIRLVKYGIQPHYLGTNNICDVQTWVDAINKAATDANQNDPYMRRTLTLARTPPNQIPEPDCSGYLYKFSHKRSGGAHWRAAYFILKEACLYLFRDQQADIVSQAGAVYYLQGYRVRNKHIEHKKYTFELIPPNRKTIRPIFLMANSEIDRKRWIAALEYSIDRWIEIN